MVLKTFNLDEEIYKQFSKYCKKEGISMSKKIENFIRAEVERMQLGTGKVKYTKDIKEVKEHSFRKYC